MPLDDETRESSLEQAGAVVSQVLVTSAGVAAANLFTELALSKKMVEKSSVKKPSVNGLAGSAGVLALGRAYVRYAGRSATKGGVSVTGKTTTFEKPVDSENMAEIGKTTTFEKPVDSENLPESRHPAHELSRSALKSAALANVDMLLTGAMTTQGKMITLEAAGHPGHMGAATLSLNPLTRRGLSNARRLTTHAYAGRFLISGMNMFGVTTVSSDLAQQTAPFAEKLGVPSSVNGFVAGAATGALAAVITAPIAHGVDVMTANATIKDGVVTSPGTYQFAKEAFDQAAKSPEGLGGAARRAAQSVLRSLPYRMWGSAMTFAVVEGVDQALNDSGAKSDSEPTTAKYS